MVPIRIPATIKQPMTELLSAFSMAAKQLIVQKKVPFEFVTLNGGGKTSKEPKVMTSFRIPFDVKQHLTVILHPMELTISSYFVLAAEKLVVQKKSSV